MKAIALILAVSMALPNAAWGACDFAKDIQKQEDGSYRYTRDCHVEAGKAFERADLQTKRADVLEKALELKDLALVKQNERVELWMNAATKMDDRITAAEDLRSKNNVYYFIGGVILTGLAVWGAGQLRH